jgi:hypothetical protein
MMEKDHKLNGPKYPECNTLVKLICTIEKLHYEERNKHL